jgi:hypothetical protein
MQRIRHHLKLHIWRGQTTGIEKMADLSCEMMLRKLIKRLRMEKSGN